MELSDFRDAVWDYLRKINDNMNRAFSPVCERNGITILQMRILVELSNYGSHTIGSLAKSINMAGTNISAMCKKLEKQGLLGRFRDQADERVVKVALTPKGSSIAMELDNSLAAQFSQFLRNEPRETLENIIEELQKLNELWRKIGR